jgi:hypothetical protein
MPIPTLLTHRLVKIFGILGVGNYGLVVMIEPFNISTQVPGYGLSRDWLLTFYRIV